MPDDIEQLVNDIGKELLKQTDKARRSHGIFTRRYWEEKILDNVMKHEAFKVQLLRYVDSYPALKTYPQIIGHLTQYLNNPRVLEDRLIRYFYRFLNFHPIPVNYFYGFCTSIGVALFAHKFIAGTNPAQAYNYINKLAKNNMTCTLDILGEAVLSKKEAEEYIQKYIDLIDGVGKLMKGRNLDVRLNVSVKPSSFYSQFNPAAPENTTDKVCERLMVIMEKAREHDAFVCMDMEQFDYRDVSLDIFEKISMNEKLKPCPHIGMVAQTYLKDSVPFAQRVIDLAHRRGTPFTVRLVKGAYWDYEIIHARQLQWEIPVYLEKWQTDACFEQVTRLFLDNYPAVKLAVASHNIRSISHAMAYAQHKGIPNDGLEFQVLYGMGDDIRDAINAVGYPVRVYAPYGELIPGMAYLVRRILENTSNESFLRLMSASHADSQQLLKNPLDLARNDNERTQFITVS
jgi:RHH-type proline utilization regulon transcriptional repressor/proline dehydrogenase/delta 1-pyrroline-5-carboxylate dehydrogenase